MSTITGVTGQDSIIETLHKLQPPDDHDIESATSLELNNNKKTFMNYWRDVVLIGTHRHLTNDSAFMLGYVHSML